MIVEHTVDNVEKAVSDHIEVAAGPDLKPSTDATGIIVKPSLGIIDTVKTYPWASFICFAAALSAVSDGYQIGMSGSIIALPGFINQFGFPTGTTGAKALKPSDVSLFGVLKTVFTGIGGAVGTWPSDKIGRKPMILVVQIILACGTVCELLATKPSHWYGARAIEGFGNGLNISITSVFIAETAPTDGRGALVAMYAVWYAIGGFLCAVTLYVVQGIPASHWRNAVYSNFAFTGAACLIWLLLPETARYHCQKGNEAGAKRSLTRLFGNTQDYDVDAEYHLLEQEVAGAVIAGEQSHAGSYKDLLRQPNLRRLIISGLPYLWQITLGVPIVSSYSAYFFQLAGMKNPFVGTLAINITTIGGVTLATYVLERVGRRTPLLTGGAICVVCCICVGGTLKSSTSAMGPGLIFLACAWAFSFSMSNNPLVYVYLSETSTVVLRAKTAGIALFAVYCFQIGWMYATPVMLNSPTIGLSNSAFIYAAAGGIGWILNYFITPETKGRSFAELDELFERRISARKFASTQTTYDVARLEVQEGMQV